MNRKQRRQQALRIRQATRLENRSRLDDPRTAFQSARVLRQAGKLDQAERLYRRIIWAQPDNWETFNNLGNILADRGELDEAAAALQRVVALNPNYADGHNNLGTVLREKGDLDHAVAAYRRALATDPDHAGVLYNLGTALRDQGKLDQAVDLYRRSAELGNQAAGHMAASLTGVTPASAPREYIRGLFDDFAAGFEIKLVEGLEYRAPVTLRGDLDKVVAAARFANVLDLGCGTGLAGVEFRSLSDRLTGVDLSQGMLNKAKEKNVYDLLVQCDIEEFLTSTKEIYDLFISADVFIYVGELENLFRCVQRAATDNAIFAFSTEFTDAADYVLNDTGRYVHSRKYIESLSRKFGFFTKICESAAIRKQRGVAVNGDLYILEFRGRDYHQAGMP